MKANGVDLLKTTLKDFCLNEVIEIESRYVVVDERLNRKRIRFFFKRGARYKAYTSELKYERFELDLLKDREEFRFFVLRHHIKEAFKKKGMVEFKNRYVLPELRKKSLISFLFFANSNSKALCEAISSNLELVEKLIRKPEGDRLLGEALKTAGNHIIHLEKESLKEIVTSSNQLQKVESFKFLEILNKSFEHFDNFFHSSNIGFSVGMSGMSSFGGYGGFGGGSFGGSGASGGW